MRLYAVRGHGASRLALEDHFAGKGSVRWRNQRSSGSTWIWPMVEARQEPLAGTSQSMAERMAAVVRGRAETAGVEQLAVAIYAAIG